jgi:hypothetical protein
MEVAKKIFNPKMNPLDIILNSLPINSQIFGNFVIEFLSKFDNKENINFLEFREYIKNFFSIEISIPNGYQQEFMEILSLYGSVENDKGEHHNRIDWKLDYFPKIMFNILDANFKKLFFTINNLTLVKKYEDKFKIKTRLKIDHFDKNEILRMILYLPNYRSNDILLEICKYDVYNKKINIIVDSETAKSKMPMIIIKIRDLIRCNYTLTDNMIVPNIVPLDKIVMKPLCDDYKDDSCVLCMGELNDKNIVVLDCHHVMHKKCMLDDMMAKKPKFGNKNYTCYLCKKVTTF